jgi:hypothetical protein
MAPTDKRNQRLGRAPATANNDADKAIKTAAAVGAVMQLLWEEQAARLEMEVRAADRRANPWARSGRMAIMRNGNLLQQRCQEALRPQLGTEDLKQWRWQ